VLRSGYRGGVGLRLALFDSFGPDLVRPWEQVLEADPEAGIFCHPAWQRAWWESLGSGDLQIALVWDGDEPIAVFPTCIDPHDEGLLGFLGSQDVTDEQVPTAVAGREVEATTFFVEWALHDARIDRIRFHSILDDGRWLQVTSEVASRTGISHQSEQVDVAPAITLPSSFDEYLAGLSKHDRHELRRKRRRLGDVGEWRVRKADDIGWEPDLAIFFECHRQAPGEKAGFFTPERELFFRRLAADLFLFGLARLDVLDLDGEPVAFTFSYDYRDTLGLYNSSFRPDLAKQAPGMVLVGALVEQSIAEGKKVFDFLRGDEPYKKRFGPVARPVFEAVLSR
jgi:CelD/BcsL family acetyltransferase involved in cellulose biosynthesis